MKIEVNYVMALFTQNSFRCLNLSSTDTIPKLSVKHPLCLKTYNSSTHHFAFSLNNRRRSTYIQHLLCNEKVRVVVIFNLKVNCIRTYNFRKSKLHSNL